MNLWTPLFCSLMLIAGGALGAFDIGGLASRSHLNNRGFTPWGRRMSTPRWLPPPHKIVGWIFIAAGVPLLLLTVTAFFGHLAR